MRLGPGTAWPDRYFAVDIVPAAGEHLRGAEADNVYIERRLPTRRRC
jgi:hypothetical protein